MKRIRKATLQGMIRHAVGAAMLLWALLGGAVTGHAQIVKMTASAPSVVTVCERFNLTYTVSISDASSSASLRKANIQASFPVIRGISVLNQSPYESQSSSMSVVNGSMQSSREVSYTFVMQASNTGTFTIDAASCEVNGASYKSNPVTIEVIQDQSQQAAGQTGTGNRGQAGGGTSSENSGKNLYFRTIVNKKTVYQGEAVSAQIKIFSKVSISSLQALQLPSFNGFYKQEVEIPQLTQLTRENVDGEIYGTGVLTQYVLFPQKSGDVTIEPATMDVEIAEKVQMTSGSWFDDFFMPQTQYVTKSLKSPEVTIKVLPLPAENKPADFSGAVGQFTLKGQMDKTRLKANETATLKLTLSGKGNFKLVNMPKAVLPPDFDTYDPKVSNSIQNDGLTGTKTAEYLMIPRHEGTYTVPAFSLSFFDPQTKQYVTLQTESYTLQVEKGDELLGGASMVSGLSREELKFLGQDIHYIQTRMPELVQKDRFFFLSGKYFACLAGMALLFLTVLLICRRHIRRNADETARRYRHAGRAAVKRLRKAREAMNQAEVERFYEELSKALWGFLGDKLSIPAAGLSKANAEEAMRNIRVPEERIEAFDRIIDICEMARYAPSSVPQDLKTVFKEAADFIAEF